MKKIFTIMLLACSISVMAVPISLDFSVEFSTGSVNSITGSIIYDAVDEFSEIDSLLSIDLSIGSYSFSANEISFANYTDNTVIGGILCGLTCISGDSNDFWVSWNRAKSTPNTFYYSLSGDGFNHIPGSYTEFSIGPVGVPEPASLSLLGIGLAAIGISRKKKAHSIN